MKQGLSYTAVVRFDLSSFDRPEGGVTVQWNRSRYRLDVARPDSCISLIQSFTLVEYIVPLYSTTSSLSPFSVYMTMSNQKVPTFACLTIFCTGFDRPHFSVARVSRCKRGNPRRKRFASISYRRREGKERGNGKRGNFLSIRKSFKGAAYWAVLTLTGIPGATQIPSPIHHRTCDP